MSSRESRLFDRARAYLVAKRITDARLRWDRYEGGDHIFVTDAGAELRVDLVIKRAAWSIL